MHFLKSLKREAMETLSLPPVLVDHIRHIDSAWFRSFTPTVAGATSNPFFHPNTVTMVIPSVEIRPTSSDVPPPLVDVYNRYPPDVEFVRREYVFLSEDEIVARACEKRRRGQTRMVDFAFCYLGMGHVRIATYDPVSGALFFQIDGGANGFERDDNFRRRIETDVDGEEKCDWELFWNSM